MKYVLSTANIKISLAHKVFLGVLGVLLFVAINSAQAQYNPFQDPDSRVAGGGSGLVASQSEIDGGTIAIGATAQVVILFRNEGGRPVSTGAINLYPSSNVSPQVTLNQCSQEPLPAGAECAIAVSLKGLQAGPWRVEMLMRHDGRTRLVTATLNGSIEASAEGGDQLISDVEAIPKELDYETLSASRAQLRSVTLRNITSTPITVDEVFLKTNGTNGLSLDTDCEELAAGQACVITVLWSPQQKGPASGVIVVKHSGPTGIATVDIKGEYTPESSEEAELFPEAVPGRGLMLSSLTEINFEDEIDTSSAITASLVNSGDAELAITDISLSGSDSGLDFETSGCKEGTVLAPLEACPLTVTWNPVRAGSILDDVRVSHTGARGVLVLPVRGTALQAVSKDSKTMVLNASVASPGFVLPIDEAALEDPGSNNNDAPKVREPSPPKSAEASDYSAVIGDKAKVLDGYSITSLAMDRAIITSPSGSRVIFDREPIVIGGVNWIPLVQFSGVEFQSGGDKVLMLFDRSLSSFNTSSSQSGLVTSSSSSEEN